MLEPENDRKFIRLIYELGKDASLPNGWTSTDADSRSVALRELSRLNASDSEKFLEVLNTEASVTTPKEGQILHAPHLPFPCH
jgi:hypothetical protein